MENCHSHERPGTKGQEWAPGGRSSASARNRSTGCFDWSQRATNPRQLLGFYVKRWSPKRGGSPTSAGCRITVMLGHGGALGALAGAAPKLRPIGLCLRAPVSLGPPTR